MKETSINDFLGQTVRALRAGDDACWPADPGAETASGNCDSQDRDAVWARIEYHGIALLLHQAADRLVGWPEGLLDRIGEEARLVALWEATHKPLVAEVIESLSDASIKSVVMKGTALAYAFHEDPALRRRGDSDLLVSPEDLDQSRAILRKCGWYRRDDPHGLSHQEGWLHEAAGFFEHSIDLHWHPTDRPVLRSRLPMSDFLSGQEEMPRLSKSARRPSTVTMITHGAINQKWHCEHGYFAEDRRVTGAQRLIWSVDFDLLSKAMSDEDWNDLAEKCEAREIGPIVAESLRGAERDLGTALPAAIIERLENAPLHPDLVTLFTDTDSLTQFWLDLRTSRNLKERAALLRHRGLPPRKHLVERYPQATGWPTPLLHLRLMFDTARRAMRRSASA